MIEAAKRDESSRPAVRLDRRGWLVAVAVGVVLLAAAWWAAAVDYAAGHERYSMPIDVLSATYKVLAVAALIIIARRLESRSMYLLAVLVAALQVGSLAVNAKWFSDLMNPFAGGIADVLPVGPGFVKFGIMFVGLAVVAGWLVWKAYVSALAVERTAVVIVIGLLLFVGIFVGPVNAISTQGYSREWSYAENIGQVVGLALLAAYAAGLVVSTRAPGIR